jgi:hypothetical protein
MLHICLVTFTREMDQLANWKIVLIKNFLFRKWLSYHLIRSVMERSKRNASSTLKWEAVCRSNKKVKIMNCFALMRRGCRWDRYTICCVDVRIWMWVLLWWVGVGFERGLYGTRFSDRPRGGKWRISNDLFLVICKTMIEIW